MAEPHETAYRRTGSYDDGDAMISGHPFDTDSLRNILMHRRKAHEEIERAQTVNSMVNRPIAEVGGESTILAQAMRPWLAGGNIDALYGAVSLPIFAEAGR